MPSDCLSVVYGSYLKGLQIGQLYRVDFVLHNECKVPPGSHLNIPGVATDNVHIRNDGGAPIIYSTNAPNINVVQGGYMIKDKERDLKFQKTNLKSVNIYVVNDGVNLLADVAIDTLV